MARSCWKPTNVSRVYYSELFSVATKIGIKYSSFWRRLYKAAVSRKTSSRARYILRHAAFLKFFGRVRRIILTPTRADTIMRLACHARVWGNFNSGSKQDRTTSVLRKNIIVYVLKRAMLQEKFGTFFSNRFVCGFRCKKDKQKIEKFKKDLDKEKKKQMHVAREHARLMEKALKEETAAKKAKRTGHKVKQKR